VRLQFRRLLGLSLLALSVVAASSIPLEPPPVFLSKWGVWGAGNSQFNFPSDVALDAAGNVYVADALNHRIQVFDGTGRLLTKWGEEGTGDGQFDSPRGVAVNSAGDIYVADQNNDRVQRFGGPWLDLFIGDPELPSGH